MEEQKRTFSPALGGSSLLVIFAALVLVVLMLLTLTTVQADQRLCQVSLDAVADYYAADLQAEEIFARLRCGETLRQVQTAEGYHRYRCVISETQVLEVTLQKDANTWNILRWQAVPITSESPSETLPVWDGDAALEEHYD